jgi:imidazolonepropionase-like amidohydrolase
MNSLLFQHVTVIDGTGSAPRADMDVLVSDGLIQAVETHGLLNYDEQQTEIYDLSGMTLLPGLIDCHVHIMMDGGPEGKIKPEESLGFCLLRAAYHARCTLEAGITTARDLGGQAHLEFALREAIKAGYCSGPRLVLAGKLLSMTSAGTEAFAGMPFVKHGDNAIELLLMVNIGLTPMQAIVASTSDAARALGLESEIGTIEVGKRADLLILDGDPLQDIEIVTRKECIRLVVQDGNVVVYRDRQTESLYTTG